MSTEAQRRRLAGNLDLPGGDVGSQTAQQRSQVLDGTETFQISHAGGDFGIVFGGTPESNSDLEMEQEDQEYDGTQQARKKRYDYYIHSGNCS